ncbi:diphthine synthase [archaeon]|jgi:diphthine synthase|nr:diphthine synthase [archaeon]MBT3577728.1 diphthine synthase [archaeon]MBT6820735.1 diphthine synthase [archaeon]MBT6955893.1 diphthine synthase [archaeon]MBT7025875.1 diphthine synthase [archaeon]
MTLNLIGLGLNLNSISAEALTAIKSSDKVYLENYTVNFPYTVKELEVSLKTKIVELDRAKVEDESIIQEAKSQNISLLVYGDSLSATTHIQLVLEAKKQKIKYGIFHNASIIIAIAETGLQLYKFGKTASMPNWAEHTNKPTSFINYIKQNQSIGAHTLILTDIGLELKDAMDQLEQSAKKESQKIDKVIAISNAGTKNQKIFYDTPKNLTSKKVKMPFALIIPGEMHFIEEEAIEELKE